MNSLFTLNTCSLGFLAVCGVVAVLFHLLPWRSSRRVLLSAVNLALLVPLVPNAQSWLCGTAFILGTYAAVRLQKARPSGNVVFATIALVIAAFLYLKRYAFLTSLLPSRFLEHPIELVGLSYMLFKFIHVLVDQWQGQLAPLSFTCYVNYQLAFFTILAGPIQRYNEFHDFWAEVGAGAGDTQETLRAWNRVLTGMIKMGAIAPVFWHFFDSADQALGPNPIASPLRHFAVFFYAYPIYLYFNFSGYTDIAVGCGALLGLRVPENFDHPYLARNVLDFWNRWHISLSSWIRDYVFMTSYKAVARRFPSRAKECGYGLLFLSLFLTGVWHGTTAGYAVFGAIHGLGAAINQIYGNALKSRLSRAAFQRYQRSRSVRLAANLLTFHFVCFSLLFFSSGVARTFDVLRAAALGISPGGQAGALTRLSPHFMIVGFLLVALLAALWKKDELGQSFTRLGQRLTGSTARLYWVVLGQSALVALLFLSLWAFQQKDTAVAYMRF